MFTLCVTAELNPAALKPNGTVSYKTLNNNRSMMIVYLA